MKNYHIFLRVFIIIIFFLDVQIGLSQYITPPAVERHDSIMTLHSDTIHDYYRWMKNKNDNHFINYLYAENAYADRVMKPSWLLRKRLYEEQRAMINEDYTTDSTYYKGYWYSTKYTKGSDYAQYLRKKDSTDLPPKVYLDGNELAKKYYYFSFGFIAISPEQRYLAYGINSQGDDKATLYIKDIDADSLLKEEIENVSNFLWLNDSVFYYIVEDKKTKRADRLYRHTLGDSVNTDSLIWYESNKAYSIGIGMTTSEKYIVLDRSGMNEQEAYYANVSTNPYAKFKLFQKMIPDHVYRFNHYKGDSLFYIHTDIGNENGKLMVCPENANTSIEKWKDLINLPDTFNYGGCFVYRNHLVYSYVYNGLAYLKVRNRKTNEEITLKGEGNNYVLSMNKRFGYDSLKFNYGYSTMIQPYVKRQYNLITGKDSIIETDTTITKYNKDEFETKRLWATSYDGTKVPVDIVYKKGIKLDGTNPTYLTAYASYGINQYPDFSENRLIYLRRGFVFALAHPRGESFLGEQWHTDGKILTKKNTYKDFIACAEMLIDSGYTSSQKIAIQGGSAGGMLMGAVVTMRPDLFKCVVLNVPFVDVLNEMQDTSWSNIIYHFKEIGNPFVKKEYDYIKSWCPYQNIKDTLYPDMLVTSGYNDSRVPVWSPSKWVAKMRYHKKDTNLLLFKTNMGAGHGGQSGRYKYLEQSSFELAFIMKSLGIKEDYITISGKIVDGNKQILPFVNVYIKGTSIGTTSNYDGEFSLDLKKDSPQTIVFQYVGFKKKEVKINMKSELSNLEIKMETEYKLLSQAIITPDGRDPAYGIIKNAQKQRKKHLKQLDAYSVDIYIKTAERLNEVPKKIPKFMKNWELPDSNDLGLLSLSESVAKYHFQAPDDYKEQMIASKVAGTKQGYSWNRASSVMLNFYENNIPMGWFGERGFISPIASSAMMYYKYKLIDTRMDNGRTIYKIKVIPRRKHDPCFKGHIYITSDIWSIYSVDLLLTKAANLKMIDSLAVRQTHIPLNDSIWMPFTIQFIQYFKIFGFGGYDNAVGTFSNYNIHPNYNNNFFGNEVFRIEDSANKQDSVYWDKSRYILLTKEENKYYNKEDSLLNRRQDPEYLDSLRKARNKYHFTDGIFSSFKYIDYPKYRIWKINPMIGDVYYNTVEGLVVGLSGGVSFLDKEKTKDNNNYWFWSGKTIIEPSLKYSITNNEFYGGLYIRTKVLSIKGGRDMVNYSSIEDITNLLYTLFLKENYAKIYQRDFVSVRTWRRIMRGLTGGFTLTYERRNPRQNATDFSFYNYYKGVKDKEFTSNNPLKPNDDSPSFTTHDVLLARFSFQVRFKQKYGTYPKWGKVYYGSKYPTLYINYKHGFYLSDSRYGFDFAQIAISDKLDMKLFGKSVYTLNFGGFLGGGDNMEFIDYKHFKGNQTIFLQPSWGVSSMVPFNSLNYFDYSTNNYFVSGRWEHHFNGWVFNKLPLFRKLKFQVLAGTAALYSADNGLFSEFFVGAENIFNALRVDFVTNYQNGKINPLLRIGVDMQL